MAAKRKYFKTRKEAVAYRDKIDPNYFRQLEVYKVPKGTRHGGEYIVTDYMGFINIY